MPVMPVSGHTMPTIQLPLVHGILNTERLDNAVGWIHIDSQFTTRHVIHLFGEVLSKFVEYVFGRPCALKFQHDGLA